MANVNVTYAEMENAATRLRNGRTEIDGVLSQLQALVKDLVSSGYVTDSSSKAFDASYEEFNTGVQKTIEGLDGMGEYLTRAAQALRETDEQLASALNR